MDRKTILVTQISTAPEVTVMNKKEPKMDQLGKEAHESTNDQFGKNEKDHEKKELTKESEIEYLAILREENPGLSEEELMEIYETT